MLTDRRPDAVITFAHSATPSTPPSTPPSTTVSTTVSTTSSTSRTALVRSRRARIVIGVLVAGVAWASLPYLAGLMGAVVLAVLLAPIDRRLAPGVGRHSAAFLLAVAAALLVVTPVGLVLATGIRRGPPLLQSALTSPMFARLTTLHLGPIDVGAQIADGGKDLVSWISRRAVAAAGSVTRTVLNLMLAVVGLYYLLLDGSSLWKRVRAWIPFSPEGADRIADRFASITEAALLGIIATAISQGATIAFGFWLVGLPNPLFWGGVTGVVSILPILGSALVWVPAVGFLLLSDRAGAALVLGLIGAIISSNIDNVVRPIIYRRVSGLHPMASLLGAFAGVELFGLMGLVLGPLAIAYCLELVRLYETEFGFRPTSQHASD